ncbi:MAG: FAD-dependent oxidoreductase, partial [Caulobacterales bacterium]|nr:FAD-dependent oxidoreductase [Caulobacterales bacterium]
MPVAGVLIIGGGQAAAQAAASLRHAGEERPICIVGEEPDPPYQRPPLSRGYLHGDLAAERLEAKPASFYKAHDITLVTGARAAAVDRSEREVWFAGGSRRSYDDLILATGARANALPDALGAGLDGVTVLRTRADADRLSASLTAGARAVIIGGGYIGLETAAAARRRGVDTVIVEAAPQLLARVAGETVADYLRLLHAERGVDVRVDAQVAAFEGESRLTGVVLSDGARLPADVA